MVDKQLADYELRELLEDTVAHKCDNGTMRPYPALLCSMCRSTDAGLSLRQLVGMVNSPKRGTHAEWFANQHECEYCGSGTQFKAGMEAAAKIADTEERYGQALLGNAQDDCDDMYRVGYSEAAQVIANKIRTVEGKITN